MSQSKEEHNNNNSNNQNLTVLDRSVSIVLEHPDETASSSREPPQPIIITPDTERLHRLHGTSLILEASHFLSLGASTFATACTIFHRFFHQRSLTEYSAWSVAMASTLLATKVEEEPQQITLKTLIQVFSHLYRKRILVAYNDITNDIDKGSSGSFWEHASLAYQKDVAQTWTLEEKHQTLEQLPLPSNKYGPVYQEWHKHIFEMEAIVLRQLGFTLYWIPDSHPHKFILYFCRVLELTDAKVRTVLYALI